MTVKTLARRLALSVNDVMKRGMEAGYLFTVTQRLRKQFVTAMLNSNGRSGK